MTDEFGSIEAAGFCSHIVDGGTRTVCEHRHKARTEGQTERRGLSQIKIEML